MSCDIPPHPPAYDTHLALGSTPHHHRAVAAHPIDPSEAICLQSSYGHFFQDRQTCDCTIRFCSCLLRLCAAVLIPVVITQYGLSLTIPERVLSPDLRTQLTLSAHALDVRHYQLVSGAYP